MTSLEARNTSLVFFFVNGKASKIQENFPNNNRTRDE